MSITPSDADAAPIPCPNCGATVERACCPECGQHRRAGNRLVVRDVLLRFFENVWDFDSAFLRTCVGLTLRPGEVCREYVSGRRKSYMNPFGYLLLAMTVSLMTESVAAYFWPGGSNAPEEGVVANPLLWFGMLVPWAVVWHRVFRSSGFNLAETYVFALFVMGHAIWYEIVLVTPLKAAGFEVLTFWLLGAMLLVYPIWAAIGLYREPRWKVVLKMLAAMSLTVVFIIAVAVLWDWLRPAS